MLLAIDVGNTLTHYGLFKGNKLIKHYIERGATRPAVAGAPMSRDWTFDEAVVCSVVPSVVPRLGVPTLFVNHKLDLGLRIKYKYPSKVGADRLANSVAVKFIYGCPAFVVDFGTAVTIDVISKNGDYLGGVIMPGLDMIRYGLNEKTALLPLAPVGKPKKILGQTTKDAIQSGMYYGILGMIKQLIDGLKKELHLPSKTVIINTGGYAKILVAGRIDQFLTLKGLRIIYERNRNNRSAFICEQ